jgi:uncharacterized repeat protein (TIGR01451 family)
MLKYPRAAALDGVSGNMRIALAATAVGALALTALAWPQTGLAGGMLPPPTCEPNGTVTTTDTLVPPAPCVLPLQIRKTATTSYDRVFDWKIDKWAKSKIVAPEKGKKSAVAEYHVDVTKELTAKRNFEVRGEIAILNPNNFALRRVEITDYLPGAKCDIRRLAQPVPTGIVPVEEADGLPPGLTNLVYRCVFTKPPGKRVVNTAIVRWGPGDDYAKAYAPVDFREATVTDHFATADVFDRLDKDDPEPLARNLDRSKHFTYRVLLSTPKKGCEVHVNTAKVFSRDGAVNGEVPNGETLNGAVPHPALVQSDAASIRVQACDELPAAVLPKAADPKGSDPKKPADPVKPASVLQVSKWTTHRRVRVGDTVTWFIKVTNRGKTPLANVKVIDRLPKQFRPVAEPNLAPFDLDGRRVTATFKWIDAGASKRLRIDTVVVGKPVLTPLLRKSARTMSPAARTRYLTHLRRGIACNIAIALAKGVEPDKDAACVRILRTAPPPPVESQPVEELAPA